MLENQRKFLEYTEKAEGLISPFDILNHKIEGQKNTLLEKLINLREEIKNKELLIPIVGDFSAGKSFVINSLLNDNILPTAITPETSLPTELRYSEKNYIEAISKDNQITTYTLSQFDDIKSRAKEYSYVRVYLDKPNLKEISPLVIVDMPGFSSNIISHHSIIEDYILKGSYFIILNKAESGTITHSLMQELQKLENRGKGFSFCLSQTNLLTPSNVLKVKEKTTEQLEDFDDFDGQITLLDNNGGENLRKILKEINPNLLFEKIFKEDLEDHNNDVTDRVLSIVSDLQEDSKSLEEEIKKIEDAFKKIEQKKEKMINGIKSHNNDHQQENIIYKVISEIRQQVKTLTNIAISYKNGDRVKTELESIIGNRLETALKEYLQSISDKTIDDFKNVLSSVNFSNSIDTDLIDSIVRKIERDVSKQKLGLDEGLSSLSLISLLLRGKIDPILQLILEFLNSTLVKKIISIFWSDDEDLKRRNTETDARNEIENMFYTTIIPDIEEKLKESLEKIIPEILSKLINTISSEFEQQLKQEQSSKMSTLNHQKDENRNIQEQIQKLQNLSSELVILKTQYLA